MVDSTEGIPRRLSVMFSKQPKLKVLPDRGYSYAVDNNGEPEIVYYRPNSNMFVNRKLDSDRVGYFVNIRRPVIFDVDNLATFEVPRLPRKCDGFIFINYGIHKSKAYALRDPHKQTMQAEG